MFNIYFFPNINIHIIAIANINLTLKYSSENFSKFFRPKAALCNRVLEVNIDELQYITYACTCSVGGSQQGTPGHITLFNVIVVKINDDVLKQSQVKCAPSSNSIRSYSTTNTTKK